MLLLTKIVGSNSQISPKNPGLSCELGPFLRKRKRGCDFVGSNLKQANPDLGSSSEFLGSMTSVDFVKILNPEPPNQ
jgi:hypothetical protein